MSLLYSNQNDPYQESNLVKYGSSMSGEDFHATNHYYYHIGLISGIVALFGVVAVLFFVISLYLRLHFEFFKCKPLPDEAENESQIHEHIESLSQGHESLRDSHPEMVADIIERVELEEHFGSLPHAVAETIVDEDEDEKEKMKAIASNSDDEYEEKLKNKLDNYGVEHAYGDEDMDKKKKLDEDEDEDEDIDEEMLPQPNYYHNAVSYPSPYPYDPYHVSPNHPPVFQQPPYPNYSHGNLHYVDPQQYNPQDEREDRVRNVKTRYSNSVDTQPQAYPWNWRRKANAAILYTLCLLTLVFLQFYVISAATAATGISNSYSRLGSLKKVVNSLFTYSNQFVSYGDSLQAYVQNAELTCKYHGHGYFTKLERTLADYRSTSLILANALAPLISDIESVQTYQKYFAQGAPLYIMWVLGMIVIALIVYFSIMENRASLKATVAFGTSVLLIFILTGSILLSLTMFFGDLCTDPSYNVVVNLPSTHEVQSIAAYYSTCNADYSNFILTDSAAIQQTINTIYNRTDWATSTSNVCPGDSNLLGMKGVAVNANNTMVLFQQMASCKPIQHVWYQLLNTEVCETFYTGVFYSWGGQLLTSFFLFLLLITASITYEFYPNYHKLNENSTGDVSEQQESLDEDDDPATIAGAVTHDPNEEKQDDPRPLEYAEEDGNGPARRRDPPREQGFVFHAVSREDEDDEENDLKRRSLLQHYDPNVMTIHV
jgi:hypothetical protein